MIEFAAFLGLTPKQNSSGGKPSARAENALIVIRDADEVRCALLSACGTLRSQ
jgi:hypothetical protein